MLLGFLPNLGFAGGGGVTAPAAFGDLTFLFGRYMKTIRTSNPTRNDTDTLIAQAQPTVRAATSSADDLNTAYAQYLSS